MSDSPAVWSKPSKIEEMYPSEFTGINKPTAGVQEDIPAPSGKADIQLYSLGTPNGWKVSILLEELGVEYDAHTVSIMRGDQFTKGFVDVNPNSKIPALTDRDGPDGKPINVFESASICLYLADKYGKFVPPQSDFRKRTEMMNWIMWQMAGQGPMTGNFGHFYNYAPSEEVGAVTYGARRYGMEVQRLCSVLDNHLADKDYILGSDYSLADIICFPWVYVIGKDGIGYKNRDNEIHGFEFLSIGKYKNVMRWKKAIEERPAVQKGLKVNTFDSIRPRE